MRNIIVIDIADIALMALKYSKMSHFHDSQVGSMGKKWLEVVRSRLTNESLNTSLQYLWYFLTTGIFYV